MRYVAEFTPVSGLVFRDARPFQAGEDSVAQNLAFPPPPEPFWSALNRTLARHCKVRRLKAHAFYVLDNRGPLLPAMADLFRISPPGGESGGERLSILGPISELPQIEAGDDDVMLPWLPDRGVRSAPCDQAFVRPELLTSYLLSGVAEIADIEAAGLVGLKKLQCNDSRTGVQLGGRNADEGKLYTEKVMFLDVHDRVRFQMIFETDIQLPNETWRTQIVRLGGEGKLAQLSISEPGEGFTEPLPADARDCVREVVAKTGGPTYRIKLCLLSPAVFSARKELLFLPGTRTPAWRPFWMNNSNGGWCREIFDNQLYRLRLVSAAAPKAFPLGAWDRAKHQPRPLHRCQPAGTVYYLELAPRDGIGAKAALDQFFDDFWAGNLLVKAKPINPQPVRRPKDGSPEVPARPSTSDDYSPLGLHGFGWTTIGVWDYAKSRN